MSRYEINPLHINGLGPHYCAVGYDRRNRTFFLQVTRHGEDTPNVYLGKSRHEYTNLEIFLTIAQVAGVRFGDDLREQLKHDQAGRMPHGGTWPAVGTGIDGWTLRASEYPQLFKDSEAIEDHTDAKRKSKKPICSSCGSDNVLSDANARWNIATQRWEMTTVFDNTDCLDCDAECSVLEIDAADVVSRWAECNDCASKSDDVSSAGTVCNNCKRGMMAVHYKVLPGGSSC
jgi:hypothetical protein